MSVARCEIYRLRPARRPRRAVQPSALDAWRGPLSAVDSCRYRAVVVELDRIILFDDADWLPARDGEITAALSLAFRRAWDHPVSLSELDIVLTLLWTYACRSDVAARMALDVLRSRPPALLAGSHADLSASRAVSSGSAEELIVKR